MRKLIRYVQKHRLLSVGIVLGAVNLLAYIFAHIIPKFADFHANTFYWLSVNVFGRLFGAVQYPVGEFLIPVLVLALICVFVARRVWHKRFSVGGAVCVVMSALFVFQFNCGINYSRTPFSEYVKLPADTAYDREALFRTTAAIIGELTALYRNTDLDTNAVPTDSDAVAAMKNLSKKYPVLKTYYPKPKGIVGSKYILSPFMLTGIYNPFTVEANYNTDCPPTELGFTMCHELSHLSGFMRESEANFIAYLACVNSDNIVLKYSGLFNAVNFCLNAYWSMVGGTDDEWEYYALTEQMSDKFYVAAEENNDYWTEYANTPTAAA
ncbi:MAG: DUF3810 domain-containing protein, partial [Oscillospiraceae bacterium]|nr:DUF3810 domain-containing protein [Oscillospiraceae bacterium]